MADPLPQLFFQRDISVGEDVSAFTDAFRGGQKKALVEQEEAEERALRGRQRELKTLQTDEAISAQPEEADIRGLQREATKKTLTFEESRRALKEQIANMTDTVQLETMKEKVSEFSGFMKQQKKDHKILVKFLNRKTRAEFIRLPR